MSTTLADNRRPQREAATTAKDRIRKLSRPRRARNPEAEPEATSGPDPLETASDHSSDSDYADASDRSVLHPEDVTAGMTKPGTSTEGGGTGDNTSDNGAVVVKNYDEQDELDAKDAHTKAGQIKLELDRKNIKKWLKRLEIQMEFCGIRSQWLKRVCLENLLPSDLCECINDIFEKEKTEAGQHIYKDCKQQLLKVHGPKPEDDYAKAHAMVLVGLPSDAAKKLRELMCKKGHKKLGDCCAAPGISRVWRELLPQDVKNQVAAFDLTTHWDEALRTADAVYKASKTGTTVAAVTTAVETATAALTSATATAGATAVTRPADLDTSADASAFQAVNQLAVQIAAFGKTFGNGNYRGRGKNRGQGRYRGQGQQRGAAGKPQPRPKPAQPHPDGPPENACAVHQQYGRNAYYCASRSTCPWKDNIVARPTNPQ